MPDARVVMAWAAIREDGHTLHTTLGRSPLIWANRAGAERWANQHGGKSVPITFKKGMIKEIWDEWSRSDDPRRQI